MIKQCFVACVLFASTTVAQDADNVQSALRFSIGDAIVTAGNKLDLSEDQKEEIANMRQVHQRTYTQELRATYGGVPGQKVTGDLFEFAKKQTEEEVKYLRELSNAHQNDLKSVLTPKQLMRAEELVLQNRFRHGGVRAVVQSSDLSLIANMDLPTNRILGETSRAKVTANSEIAKLVEEFEEFKETARVYRRKVAEIKKREVSAALDRLGKDGDELKVLLDRLSELTANRRTPYRTDR